MANVLKKCQNDKRQKSWGTVSDEKRLRRHDNQMCVILDGTLDQKKDDDEMWVRPVD